MHDPAFFRMMAEYNQWMNEKLYAICGELSDDERKRDRGAFFKSIHGTLDHLLYGDRAWLARFTDRPANVPELGAELYCDFEQLRRDRREIDRSIIEWTSTLTADWLEAPFEYISKVDDKTRTLPAWTLVVHMFNHQTHHRGQLTTLLRQAGRDPGVTDLPWLPDLVEIAAR